MTVRAPLRPVGPADRETIDPRIRARRIEVKRTEGRRRLRRASALGIVAAMGAGSWWLTLTPLFDVDHIRVQGAAHTGEDAVVAAIGIQRGDALLTADVGRAAAALAELPWVQTASVRRAWPGSVSVSVVERTPVAAIAARAGGWVLVDRGGRQLAVADEPPLELVRVAGLPVSPRLGIEVGSRYRGALDLAAVVPPSLRGTLGSLWPQRDGTIEATVQLAGDVTAVARFGLPAQLEAKLVALAAVLERAELDRVRIIDLRVPGAPALTRA